MSRDGHPEAPCLSAYPERQKAQRPGLAILQAPTWSCAHRDFPHPVQEDQGVSGPRWKLGRETRNARTTQWGAVEQQSRRSHRLHDNSGQQVGLLPHDLRELSTPSNPRGLALKTTTTPPP